MKGFDCSIKFKPKIAHCVLFLQHSSSWGGGGGRGPYYGGVGGGVHHGGVGGRSGGHNPNSYLLCDILPQN